MRIRIDLALKGVHFLPFLSAGGLLRWGLLPRVLTGGLPHSHLQKGNGVPGTGTFSTLLFCFPTSQRLLSYGSIGLKWPSHLSKASNKPIYCQEESHQDS